jgi:hypothetical protein
VCALQLFTPFIQMHFIASAQFLVPAVFPRQSQTALKYFSRIESTANFSVFL